MSEQEVVGLREYFNEKLAQMERVVDEKAHRLERALETEFARLAKQRVEDKITLDVRLGEHQASHDREHVTAQQNAEKDEKKLDTRLLTMNEIREQLNQQAATFARTEYVDARFTSFIERMEAADRNNESRREADTKTIVARLDSIEKHQVQGVGRSGGSAQAIAYVVLALTVVGMLVNLFLNLGGR